MLHDLNLEVFNTLEGEHLLKFYSPDLDLNSVNVGFFTYQSTFAHQVIHHLNNLNNHFNKTSIVYFGDLSHGSTTYFSTLSACQIHGIIPVFIGIHDQIMCENLYESEVLHLITNRIPPFEKVQTKLNFIGYQRHLNSLLDTLTLENLFPNSASLGKIATFPYIIEPILRDAIAVHCDLGVLKKAEIPHSLTAYPTGFTAEQFCQMGKYIGMSDRLKVLGVAPTTVDTHNQVEAQVAATFLWYFLEGLNMKSNNHPKHSTGLQSFLVTNALFEEEMTFVQNNDGKFWLKLEIDSKVQYLACAEEEYKACLNNDVPLRLQKYMEYITE